MSAPLRCLATTTPGLEPLLAGEVSRLGADAVLTDHGGVEFDANADLLADALLGLRTAHRVTVRLAAFRARTFAELERHAAAIAWNSILDSAGAAHFRVTSKKSRLYHQDAIAERLERSVVAALPRVEMVRAAGAAEQREAEVDRLPDVQRFIVRLHRDEVTISADAAGALLHRRGWRRDVAKAPLRETLAAAMLLGLDWQGREPLHDPFCGSGTIPIEAALLARNIAPGIGRRFAAECWPSVGAKRLDAARLRARALERTAASTTIAGSDRDAGAIRAAIANAERAGVSADVVFERGSISAIGVDDAAGLLICNPPYGVRIGDQAALRNLYASLGAVQRERRPGWQLALLSASPLLEGQIGVPLREVWHTTNGGIAVRLVASR